MEYGVGLTFSGAMSRLKVEQWIRSMEEHMEHNKVGSEDMVHYAINYLVEEAATWWRMHQAIDESRRKITWKEFTRILLGSRLVTPTQRTVNLKKKEVMKKVIQELKEASMMKKKKDISQIWCYRCRDMGHYTDMCPERKEAPVRKEMKDISQIQCYRCRNMGHYSNMCPELKGKKKT